MARQIPDQSVTRRGFLGGAAVVSALALLSPHKDQLFAQDAPPPAGKPNSLFNGVRVGAITYSYRGGVSTAEYTLDCLVKDGLSETELMDGPIRSFASMTGGGRGGRGRGGGQ